MPEHDRDTVGFEIENNVGGLFGAPRPPAMASYASGVFDLATSGRNA